MARHLWWLAHHPEDECNDKCIDVRGFYVCSRCAGLYPGMTLGVVVGLWSSLDPTKALILYAIGMIPGWFQWALELLRLYPRHEGTKKVRLITGMVAGWSAGLLISTHIRSPWNESFLWGAGITVLVSALVIVTASVFSWLSE